MNKIKTLKIIIGLLLMINLGLLSFFFIRKGPPHHHGSDKGKAQIKKTFNFDDNQMIAFEESRAEHKDKSKTLTRNLHEVSKVYYSTADKVKQAALLDSITTISRQIYLANDEHFSDIRTICRPDQEKHMGKFINTLINRKGRKPKKK